ncbi:hypothetical protein ACI48D_25450 [Massilia sp. LXY-6]|uniref:hypothetical protein n=1 Tax=Massilia sp. LXY-6 TaxID=3379823 RepID=UPI003EE1F85E
MAFREKPCFLAAALLGTLAPAVAQDKSAVPYDAELAKSLGANDPVIVNGEMVAEYHSFFGSAALMAVNELHAKIQKPKD